ncbi:hypothetical protein DFA_12111 [Cavenderia fasciculata]|uniref:Uncharacterized protein n=1 Tax=Cavenderia fasciculata TaxID=261658 RepID=F4QFU4_CACFS|nr:uncharacterized protein DFA_12111 [Cavenderia fasciculata]EGG14341.1 hypothetical protein DFA_12111 [Cavenderia fasciculata]|eukprot:XP_004351050.1 hypothetical protein DFA_12111 [Cavenderia fasciculata]
MPEASLEILKYIEQQKKVENGTDHFHRSLSVFGGTILFAIEPFLNDPVTVSSSVSFDIGYIIEMLEVIIKLIPLNSDDLKWAKPAIKEIIKFVEKYIILVPLVLLVGFVCLWIGFFQEYKETIEEFYRLVPPSKLLYFIKHPETIVTKNNSTTNCNNNNNNNNNLPSLNNYKYPNQRFINILLLVGFVYLWIGYYQEHIEKIYSFMTGQLPPSKLLYFIQHPETIAKEFSKDTPLSHIYYSS